MNTANLRVTQTDWSRLRLHFQSSFREVGAPETGAIGVVGVSAVGDRREYLLAKVFWPQSGDLKIARDDSLVFDASYVRRAHLHMREHGLAGLVVFHTHPMADAHVQFSWYDDEQEPSLARNLSEIAPSTRFLSVVAGRRSQCGREWTNAGAIPLGELVVVGETIAYESLAGELAPAPPHPADLFDRARALSGAGAQARLARMTIGLVGASGTGSLVGELLARAGCRRILPIDDDVVKTINLNRILYATQQDAELRTPKVQVLRRGIEGLGIGCVVDPVMGNVLDAHVLARLRMCDVIIGCVDKAFPRKLLGEFAHQYLRPYIDIGTEIGTAAKTALSAVASVDARVSYVAPGRPCLSCTGLVTPQQLAFESLTSRERARVLAQGYSDHLRLVQPAVMDLNMRPAGLAVLLLRHLLQPFMATPLPATIMENLITGTTRLVREARSANPTCRTCAASEHIGWGDCGPTIGLEGEVLAAITEPLENEELPLSHATLSGPSNAGS